MNLIIFVGPPAAGKDTLIYLLLDKLKKYPNRFKRALYYSTRKKRPTDVPGKNILLISREKFLSLGSKIVSQDISNKDLVGYGIKELTKAEYVLIAASKKNLPELNNLSKKYKGKTFTAYIDVPKSVRKERLEKRLDSPGPEYVKNKLKFGVGYVPVIQRKIFTKVYKNPDNKAEQVTSQLLQDIECYFHLT